MGKIWRSWVKPFVEIAGLIALIIYTCYAGRMARAAKKSADAATVAATAATSAAKTAADTLSETQEGETDTHTLAIAAGKQADAAKSQSDNTESIAKAAQAEIATSTNSAEAAKNSADTAARELELSERPWVDADVRINGPLAFNVNGANLSILITLRNTGHSPAFNTTINPQLMIIFGGPDPFQLRNEVCQGAVKQVSSYGFGVSLFPNSDFQSPMSVGLGKQDIEKAEASFSGELRGKIVGLNLVVCIAYRPTFNNTSVYTTGYIFDVIEIDKNTNLPGITFPLGEEVGADRLRLQLGPGAIVAN